MRIGSKAEFFRLWEAGCLGNTLRTWRDPAEAIAAGVLVGFREIGKAGGGAFAMAQPGQIRRIAASFPRPFMICEAAPDDRGTIQGEVCRTTRGWEGTIGHTTGLRMREAIAKGLLRPVSGAAVVGLLHAYMGAADRDDLDGLLDLYPDATVEFTCYDRLVGKIPGRNTLFWEVRDY